MNERLNNIENKFTNEELEKLDEINKVIAEIEARLKEDESLNNNTVEQLLKMLRKEKSKLESKI